MVLARLRALFAAQPSPSAAERTLLEAYLREFLARVEATPGLLLRRLGEHTAEITFPAGGAPLWRWLKDDGRPQKSVPAAVRETHATELAELKRAVKDVQAMLPAQRERLERLYLENRAIPFAHWKSYYLDHPLVGQLARRLIWRIGEQGSALWQEGRLVGSEVMRMVDLFVGVASIGNDPAWEDQGGRRHYEYWRSYAFGDLNASAETRRAVLERLLPRLRIAPRSRIEGRFLVVEGSARSYRIHLGSGNVLMEPNDQYLCIVPDRSKPNREAESLFLPFEGDRVLALILSKAFLLADDTRITDTTFLSRIHRG